ncbi:putative dehydrogenase [Roseibium hamelinense]|uniref:Putative dehydrogenase n=1 Tax=Roseibium hamelinense TaxID=150831 RepID=A0A562T7S9_9HYPH|nr:Gfo/Idh/MocA family oxidoreductase [Roseibium hamelinense]MTI43488.1 Gfo/Idh/MocA family oxidoreductase [Roseibium hamelinense]TWI89719.1 putative dehydrogenase [Roseibium hamelinense]
MAGKTGIGIVGCGNISRTYFKLIPLFGGLEIKACADLNREMADHAAAANGIRSQTVHDLLAADDLDIIVNLTEPDAHWAISKQILNANKHLYSELPLVTDFEQMQAMLSIAMTRKLKVGAAPDSFLGGAFQAARVAIDSGRIGTVVSGTCFMMMPGMETRHPHPDIFYRPGAGPLMLYGLYHITHLVNLLGPVARVAAMSAIGTLEREITSGARKGERFPVQTPTTVQALLQFESGANITLSTSWDVVAHRHFPIEIYGTEGTLVLPDPLFFGGDVHLTVHGNVPQMLDASAHPFSRPNQSNGTKSLANYRAAGLADMAQAIKLKNAYRCSMGLAMHALDTALSILKSAEIGAFVDVETPGDRPEQLSPEDAKALLS